MTSSASAAAAKSTTVWSSGTRRVSRVSSRLHADYACNRVEMSALDGDGAGRAELGCLLHLLAQLLAGLLLEEVEEAVVADLEHLRRDTRARAGADAAVVVDDDLHRVPLSLGRTEPVGLGCRDVAVAPVGLGSGVVEATGHVVDAGGHLRLDRMRRRALAIDGIDPRRGLRRRRLLLRRGRLRGGGLRGRRLLQLRHLDLR